MNFDFNQYKNDKLFKERGISFSNIIEAIEDKGILLNFEHPNKDALVKSQLSK